MPPGRDLHFVIAIGINHYPGHGLENLNYARSDAQAFARWVQRADGVPSANIRVLTATNDEARGWRTAREGRPVRDQVNDALDEFNDRVRARVTAAPEAWDNTRLYVFVAGHGYGVPGGPTALIMANARSDKVGESLALGPYLAWLERCEYYREVIFLADCCRNEIEKAPDPPDPPFNTCDPPKRGVRTMIGYATLPDATAAAGFTPEPDNGRGHFTRLLIAALRGAAPGPGEAITAESVRDYIIDNLPKRTRDTQLAQIYVSGGGIVFRPSESVRRPRPAHAPSVRKEHPVTIEFTSGYSGNVTLLDGDLEPQETWNAADGPWNLLLGRGLWAVRFDDAPSPNEYTLKIWGEGQRVEL